MAHEHHNVGSSSSPMREYRKGNWTVHETMVLIEAKRMDEERRMKRSSTSMLISSSSTTTTTAATASVMMGGGGDQSAGVMRSRPAELRWKWVEDYCWSNGCLRSQNQCNDKWDNLMRDYKKVREYERRRRQEDQHHHHHHEEEGSRSYWKLEKHERKDRNLPTNMLAEIYEALVELLERRSTGGGHVRLTGDSAACLMTTTTSYALPMTTTTTTPHVLPPTPTPTPTIMPSSHQQNPSPLPLPPPHPSPTTFDSDSSDHSNSPAKRRRRGGDQGTSTSTPYSNEGVGSAISRGATIIAEALQACEEREEKRHRECLSVQERRLKIEESKSETDREAINGLVHAINNLATSIFALVSDKSQQTTPPK